MGDVGLCAGCGTCEVFVIDITVLENRADLEDVSHIRKSSVLVVTNNFSTPGFSSFEMIVY